MIKKLAVIALFIGHISAVYVSERAGMIFWKKLIISIIIIKILQIKVDLTNSEIRDDIRIEIFDEKFNGKNFPDRFKIILNGIELDFVKFIKRGPNAHGIYFVGNDNSLTKHHEKESKVFSHR